MVKTRESLETRFADQKAGVIFKATLTESPSRVDVKGWNGASPSRANAMSLSLWFRSPRHLLTLFLAIMLVLAASLSWLS